jgi:hypothetical protein
MATRFLVARFLPRVGDLLLLGAELLLLIAEFRGFLEVLLGDGLFLRSTNGLDFLRETLDVGRADERSDARARTGFVHDVDGLVRQETPGDVAVRKLHGGLDGACR